MIKLVNRCLTSIGIGLLLSTAAVAANTNALSGLIQAPEVGSEGVNAHIAGGEQVSNPETFPWMANLRNESGDSFCGAVLVDQQNLLTAAHCVAQLVPNQFSVVFGSSTASNDEHSVNRTWIPVGFRWSHLSEDFAVIHLDAPVDKATLNLASLTEVGQLNEGEMLNILGFGQLQENGGLSQVLHIGAVPFVNSETCASRWQGDFPSVADMILQENVCASGDGYAVDTCLGDSGGPLLYNNGDWNLIGLTSFGEQSCGAAEKPSVYTNVAAFSSAISKALAGETYYANWTQVLIGDDPALNAQQITIKNETQQPWSLDAYSSVEQSPFHFNKSQSTCANSTLLPGDSCQVIIEFDPQTGGFAADRFLISRTDQEPIWIDLQGFGYDYIPKSRFGQHSIFGFTGGEVTPEQTTSEGISGDGFLQWSQLNALDNSEIYIGTGIAQTIKLYFDYQGTEEQKPIVKVQVLNAQAQTETLDIDLNAGWQSQTFELAADDYLFVNIQARGYGMSGTLKMDVAPDSQVSEVETTQQLSGTQISSNQINTETNTESQPVQVKSGGSLSWSFLAMIMTLFYSRTRRPRMTISKDFL